MKSIWPDFSLREVVIKCVKNVFCAGVAFFVLYGLLLAIGSSWTVNDDFIEASQKPITIYIKTDGLHMDLVLPLHTAQYDWRNLLKDCSGYHKNHRFVAFGWGDRAYYLESKSPFYFNPLTAFNAMAYLSRSAMHLTFLAQMRTTKKCKAVKVSEKQYLKLVEYIKNSLKHNVKGCVEEIKGAAYWQNDAFFESEGKYSLFFTCNTWLNNGLREAGLRACFWTVLDWPILEKYAESEALKH